MVHERADPAGRGRRTSTRWSARRCRWTRRPQALAKLADRSTVGKVVLGPLTEPPGAPTCGRDCCAAAPGSAASRRRSPRRPTSRSTSRPARLPEPAGRLPLRHPRRAARARASPAARSSTASAPASSSPRSPSAAGPGGRTPELAAAQFAVLPVMRQLHEMLWYLTEALDAAGRRRCTTTSGRRSRGTEGWPPAPPRSCARSTSAPTAREVGELLGRVSDARPRPGAARPPGRRPHGPGPAPAPACAARACAAPT